MHTTISTGIINPTAINSLDVLDEYNTIDELEYNSARSSNPSIVPDWSSESNTSGATTRSVSLFAYAVHSRTIRGPDGIKMDFDQLMSFPPYIAPVDRDARGRLRTPFETILSMRSRDVPPSQYINYLKSLIKKRLDRMELYDPRVNAVPYIRRDQTYAPSDDYVNAVYNRPMDLAVPYAYVEAPFRYIIDSKIFNALPIEAYEEAFTRYPGRTFRVSFEFGTLTFDATNTDARPPISSMARNPFSTLYNLKNAIADGHVTVGANVHSQVFTVSSYSEFKDAYRRIARTRGGLSGKYSELSYTGFMPVKVHFAKNISNLPLGDGELKPTATWQIQEIPDITAGRETTCVLKLVTQYYGKNPKINHRRFNSDGVSLQVLEDFREINENCEAGVSINDLFTWNEKKGYPLSIRAFSPDGSLIRKHVTDKKMFRSLNIVVNNGHAYDVHDHVQTLKSSDMLPELPYIDFTAVSGDYVIMDYTTFREQFPSTADLNVNVIVTCDNPKKSAGLYVSDIITADNIGYILINNKLVVNGYVISFESVDLYDRRLMATRLQRLTGYDNFDIYLNPAPSWNSMGRTILEMNAGKSNIYSRFNHATAEVLDEYRCWAMIWNEESSRTAVDIRGCYPRVAVDNVEPYCKFNELSFFEPFTGDLDPGYYIIKPFRCTLKNGAPWESSHYQLETRPYVKFMMESGLITREHIYAYMKPVQLLPCDLLGNVIERLRDTDLSYDAIKSACNRFIGYTGKKHHTKRAYFTTVDEDTAYATKRHIHETQDNVNVHIDQYGSVYLCSSEKKEPLHKNLTPLNTHIVSSAKLLLLKTAIELDACGYHICAYNTDCVFIRVDDDEDGLPPDYDASEEEWDAAMKRISMEAGHTELPTSLRSYCVLKDESPREMGGLYGGERTYKPIKFYDSWNVIHRSDLADTGRWCLEGPAGSGKSYLLRNDIIRDRTDMTLIAYTHAAKNNLHRDAHTFASLVYNGKELPTGILLIDEFGVLGKKELIKLVRARDAGAVIKLAGDVNQSIPFDGGYIDLMNSPALKYITDGNRCTLMYNPDYGRYPINAYDAFESFKNTGVLPDALVNRIISYDTAVNYPEFQVITQRINGPASHKSVNRVHGYSFRKGETVRLRVNDYLGKHENLSNGVTGTIVAVNASKRLLRLREFPGVDISADHVELAHCITVVRAQGSGFEKVLIYELECMETRNEVYTALTRAMSLENLFIVGDRDYLASIKWEWAEEHNRIGMKKLKPLTNVIETHGYHLCVKKENAERIISQVETRVIASRKEMKTLEAVKQIYTGTAVHAYVIKNYPERVAVLKLVGKRYVEIRKWRISQHTKRKEACSHARAYIQELEEKKPIAEISP